MPEPDPPVVDTGVLDELASSVGGDTGFVAELIGTYLDDAPVHLAEIAAAGASGDAAAMVRPAHTLKSSSANIGGTRLAALCLKLEQAALNQSAAEAAQHLAGFNMEYFEVEEALKALLLDLRNSATAATAAAQPNSGV